MIFASDVYRRYPFMRRLIGNHGDRVLKVRPVTSRLQKALGVLNIRESYVIMDLDWRRELVPLSVSESRHLVGESIIKFSELTADEECQPVGLIFYEKTCWAWICNDLYCPKIKPEDTLTCTYKLEGYGLWQEYLPYEDIEYENLR